MRYEKYLMDRRHPRKGVAIGDLNHPEIDSYIICNSYFVRLYNAHTISQQMMVNMNRPSSKLTVFFKLYPTPKAVMNGNLTPNQYFTPKRFDHQDIAVVSPGNRSLRGLLPHSFSLIIIRICHWSAPKTPEICLNTREFFLK